MTAYWDDDDRPTPHDVLDREQERELTATLAARAGGQPIPAAGREVYDEYGYDREGHYRADRDGAW